MVRGFRDLEWALFSGGEGFKGSGMGGVLRC